MRRAFLCSQLAAFAFAYYSWAPHAEALVFGHFKPNVKVINVFDFGVNQSLVEELYLKYKDSPGSIDEAWRRYFESLESGTPYQAPPKSNGHASEATGHAVTAAAARSVAIDMQQKVDALVEAYRTRGHKKAKLDPLGLLKTETDELSLERFGLSEKHLEQSFATDLPGKPTMPLKQIVSALERAYCGTIGVELDGIEDPTIRGWLLERVERLSETYPLSNKDHLRALKKLSEAELFEQFIHTNYVGTKRFSLEGGESTIPFIDTLIDKAGELGVEEVVFGMAHRGRLNVLVNILGKKHKDIFLGFEDATPEQLMGRGDVKYHLGYSSDRKLDSGKNVHLSMCFNPSHLEFVNPVVEGRVRAKQDRRNDKEGKRVMPLLVHGDAAFIGQGIVPETLNMAALEGYRTGGTLHLVINNQVGFTTDTGDSRSTRYSTDITRMVRCPVLHVNGDDVEAVLRVARLAAEFRQRFSQDVVVDLYCYRRYGHNEADEPRFTQPQMYAVIDKLPGVRTLYAQQLVSAGTTKDSDVNGLLEEVRAVLNGALTEARSKKEAPAEYTLQGVWKPYVGGADHEVPEAKTAVPKKQLIDLAAKIFEVPKNFQANPKIAKLLEDRKARVEQDKPLDWGTGEALAFATLLAEGAPVRVSGQDSRRGTFSHRHAAVYDIKTGERFEPSANISDKQGRFSIYDSPLSEAGVLGFEYGYSLDAPEALVVWEAQFGDFANGAQVIIDQFICSSEDKWRRLSGLTLLLPHAFEGQGPEHSSARLERFLAACAEDNIQVCNLTTPAQLFHCLRRQVVRSYRKPLIIMSPKSLLRHPKATSTVKELSEGAFQRIINDADVNASKVKRVLLCSGKVYYDLVADREKRKADDAAIIRLEQFYPLHPEEVLRALEPYKRKGVKLIWVQEEPLNMGAWYFLNAHLPRVLGNDWRLECVARDASASPATGSHGAHQLEQQRLMQQAFEG